MTDFLNGTLKIGNLIKILISVILPIVFFLTTLEKRITLLEYKFVEINRELKKVKENQEQIVKNQIRILYYVEREKK